MNMGKILELEEKFHRDTLNRKLAESRFKNQQDLLNLSACIVVAMMPNPLYLALNDKLTKERRV